MRKLAVAVWAAAYLVGASAAQAAAGLADLSRAEWGSSKAQVQAAYPLSQELLGDDGKPLERVVLKIDGPITLAGRTWKDALFRFDKEGRLDTVELDMDQSQLSAVSDWLAATFGTPREVRGQVGPSGRLSPLFEATYRHVASGDTVQLQSVDFLGYDFSKLKFMPPDPKQQQEILRVQRLRELQTAGVAKASGWDRSRWYMTRDELKAAYPVAQPNDVGGLVLAGPVTWQDRSWRQAEFVFKLDIGLNEVLLRASPADMAAIDADMRRLHGPPVEVVGELGSGVYSAWYKLPAAGAYAEVFYNQIGDYGGSGVSFRPIKD